MVTKAATRSVPVYSTEHGRLCQECGKAVANCTCSQKTSAPKNNGSKGNCTIKVGRATKGRKGSGVTTVSGLPLTLDQLRLLAGQLKKQCGAGGAVKDGIIEIQGEHRDLLVTTLQELGYTVKRTGG